MKEIIDVACYLLSAFICTLFYNLCYATINNYKMKVNLKNVFIFLITAILILLNNIFLSIGVKAFFNLICLSLELKIVFRDNIKKIVINYILIYFCISLIEIIMTKILLVFDIITNNSSANTVTYINLVLTVIITISVYLIVNIKKVRNFFKKIISFFGEKEIITNIIYLIFFTIAVLSILYIENFSNTKSFQMILILFIIFSILFILIVHSKCNEDILKKSNEKLINYNDKYGKFLDEYKIYKHNIKHKLSAIKSYGNKKVNALIDDLLEEETDFSIKNNNLYNVPDGIKGIVAEKLYNSNFNVLVDNKIKKDPFKDLSPKAFNSISESIGIALDNAIEASSETENPIIMIELKESKDELFIKIGNNFCNSIDIEKLGIKYYSTKNRGSGLGLFSIVRNKLVKEKINIINDFYYIELQIKKAR